MIPLTLVIAMPAHSRWANKRAELRCRNGNYVANVMPICSRGRSQEDAGVMDMISREPWLKTDLFFLQNSLDHGMSFAEAAGFLCRTEEEVREKAKELNRVRGMASNAPTRSERRKP